MTSPLLHDKVWLDKNKYDEAERQYFEKLAKGSSNTTVKLSLAGEVAKARQHIKDSLKCMDGIGEMANLSSGDLLTQVAIINQDRSKLWKAINSLCEKVSLLEENVKNLQGSKPTVASSAQPTPVASSKVEDEDDGVDLFGSDSEDESAEVKKVKEDRLAAYAAKKSKKPVIIAKSNIILDVKPWDDETDMKLMEKAVREVTCDGLLWGASKLVPLAYGIHKLQISCVVEDDKVSVDWLQETLEEIEDYVQSVDIAAFNKV